MMDKTTGGWIGLIACVGLMSTLLSAEVAGLTTWNQVVAPAFIAKFMVHLGVVIGAFISGKIIPESRGPNPQTRNGDK